MSISGKSYSDILTTHVELLYMLYLRKKKGTLQVTGKTRETLCRNWKGSSFSACALSIELTAGFLGFVNSDDDIRRRELELLFFKLGIF